MELKDPFDLGNRLRLGRQGVAVGDDELALNFLKVGRPVGDDAVGALRAITFSAVADDGVNGQILAER